MADQGMFGSLYGTEREDQKERMRREFARMTPDQQIAYTGMRGAEMAGEGFGSAISGALGGEPAPEQKRAQAAKELQQLAQTVAPGTMDFYKQAIAIMQKYGMVEEAARFQDAIAKLEQTQRTIEAPTSDIGKLEHDRKIALDRYKDDPAAQARVNKYFDDRAGKLGTVADASSGLSGTAKLQRDKQAALARGDQAAADEIQQQIDANIANAAGLKPSTPHEKVMEAQGQARTDAVVAGENRQKTKDDRKAAADDRATVAALQGVYRTAAQALRDAIALYNHKGLSGITGPVYGRTPSVLPESTSAMAKFEQVQGETFLAALAQLKSASKNGSSGLGQLTEIEGAKIQNAKAALSRIQPTDSFRKQLALYGQDLMATMNSAKKELAGAGASAPEIPGMPAMAAPAAPADLPKTPASAPAAPAAGGWGIKKLGK